jgi:5'-phosphate synthase pdxT subunit
MKIGILGMQGDIEEHLAAFQKLGVDTIRVKSEKSLESVDGLIIPGGESTTMLRLLKLNDLFDLLKLKISKGFPVYGTCAGMILLADQVSNPEQDSLKVLDINVSRNGYGRQIDSFQAEVTMPVIGSRPFKAIFIRAPLITKAGDVEVLATYKDHPVFVKKDNIIASTFHPELSNDTRIHEFFLGMVKDAARN